MVQAHLRQDGTVQYRAGKGPALGTARNATEPGEKLNFFKTLEINQRPITIQGGFILEKWLNLGGKANPVAFSTGYGHTLSPAMQWPPHPAASEP